MASQIQIRVGAGRLKNRTLRRIPAARGHENYTPKKLVEALFSLLENRSFGDTPGLWEKAGWVDLFGGSGQVGLEAISRGFGKLVYIEKDRDRFSFFKDICRDWDLETLAEIQAFASDFEMALKKLTPQLSGPWMVFMDPPFGIRRRGELLGWLAWERYLRAWVEAGPADRLVVWQLPQREFQKDLEAKLNQPENRGNWEYRTYGSQGLLLLGGPES